MSTISKAENISKQYQFGKVGTGTLGDELKRWWYNERGKEDPFLKIGGVNNRNAKATIDYIKRAASVKVFQGDFYNTGKLNPKYNAVILPCLVS